MSQSRILAVMLAAALVGAAGCSSGPISGPREIKDANWTATIRLCELHENYKGPHDSAETPKALLLKVKIVYTGPDAEVELPTVTVELGPSDPLKPSRVNVDGGIDGAGFIVILNNQSEKSFLRTGDIVEPGENCTWVFSLPPAAKEGQLRIGKLLPIPLHL